MPKLKTNKGAAKRFKLTGSGRIKRRHAGKRHILTKMSSKQKRSLSGPTLVHPSDESMVKRLLKLK